MPKYRPPSHNRLLALEKELLEKKRLSEERYSSNKSNQKAFGAYSFRVEPDNGDRPTYPRNNRLLALEQEILGKPRKPKTGKHFSKRSRVKSQVFDTGEAIRLEYNSEVFPLAPPEEIRDVDKLQIESSQPEVPVISNTQIAEDISHESENLLSQTTEFISEIEPKSHHFQTEDISPNLAEENTNPGETAATSLSPQEESRNLQNNPHAVFDSMGKNMAYATTFDLGTIELEQLFDEFDCTLDKQEQVNKSDSLSQAQGNLELEQRFDEFDCALELEEQVNSGSVSQRQEDLELEQRFNEFDSTLEQQENTKTPIEPTQTKSPSEIISEKIDSEIQKPGNTEKKAAEKITLEKITFKPATDAIHNQNQQYLIVPLTSRQVELVQPLHPNTPPKFDFNLQALLFRTGINIISLIVWLLNLLRRNHIPLQTEINSQSTLSVIPYGDRTTNKLENLNSQIIDIRQNDFTDGISPFILSSQQSTSLITPTAVDASTPHRRDSLTGMLYGELIGQNSYPLTNYSKVIKAENKSNPNTENLHETSCHPPKERRNDSS